MRQHEFLRPLAKAPYIFSNFKSMLWSSERSEAGNALPEYAIVLALFSIAAMGGLTLLGNTTSQVLNSFQSNLTAYNLRHA